MLGGGAVGTAIRFGLITATPPTDTESTFAVGDDGLLCIDRPGLSLIDGFATIALGVLAAVGGQSLTMRRSGRP